MSAGGKHADEDGDLSATQPLFFGSRKKREDIFAQPLGFYA